MAYNNAIPQATDQLSQSQQDILNNFIAIKTLVDVNHVTFDAPDQGKHKWVTMPVQLASPPVGAFVAGEVGFYNFNYPVSTNNEIYINTQDGRQIPITAGGLSGLGDMHGYSFLPSGALVKWGLFNGIAPGNNAVVLPLIDGAGNAIPDFTTFLNAQITTIAVAITGSVRFNGYVLGTRTLTVNADISGGTVGMYYYMIGT